MMHCWQEPHGEGSAGQRRECRASGRRMTSVCPTAGDVNLDGLAKVVSARSLRYKGDYFSLYNLELRLNPLVLVLCFSKIYFFM